MGKPRKISTQFCIGLVPRPGQIWALLAIEGAADLTFAATGARPMVVDRARRWPRVRASCAVMQHEVNSLSSARLR